MRIRTTLLLLFTLFSVGWAEPKVVLVPGFWEGSYRPIEAQRIDELLNEELGGSIAGVAHSVARPASSQQKAEMLRMAKESGARYLLVPSLECRRSIEPLTTSEGLLSDRFSKAAPEHNSLSIAGVGTLVIHDLSSGTEQQVTVLLLESRMLQQRPGTQAFELQEQNLAERLVRSFGQDLLRRLQ